MPSHLTTSLVPFILPAVALALAGCAFEEAPTEPPGDGRPAAAAMQTAASFGPFPGRTTVFVDVANTTGTEDGSRSHPFNTLSEALAAARDGDVVGVAPGVYAQTFPSLTPNYVIDGLRNFALVGMGPERTIIRGDHSFSLIRVQNGASGRIQGLTIEHGGRAPNSEGGGIQVLGLTAPVSLTIAKVVLRDNQAVNGGAIAAEGRVTLRLVNVLIADNQGSNCCGGVILRGTFGNVRATFRNATITGNTATFHAGGVLVERARLNLVNSIIWNNSLAELGLVGEEPVSVTFSDVGERLWPGTGNISANPRFLDPLNRDYRLKGGSPAVDHGTDVDAPPDDIRGFARPHDGNGDGIPVTDMGAYEFGKIFTTAVKELSAVRRYGHR